MGRWSRHPRRSLGPYLVTLRGGVTNQRPSRRVGAHATKRSRGQSVTRESLPPSARAIARARAGPIPGTRQRSSSGDPATAATEPNRSRSSWAHEAETPGMAASSAVGDTTIRRLPTGDVARSECRRASCSPRTSSQSALSSGERVCTSLIPLLIALSRAPRRARGCTGPSSIRSPSTSRYARRESRRSAPTCPQSRPSTRDRCRSRIVFRSTTTRPNA
jgi:hypothetical protein